MADLETRCQEAFRDALEFAKLVQASDKWRTESEDNDFIVSHHPGIGADMEMVRTSMNINKPASEVISFLGNPFKKREYDEVLVTLDVIEDYGDVKCIFYQNNLPWPLDSRETVYAEGSTTDPDGTHYILSRSIAADEVPIDEGYTRAHIILFGHIIKPVSAALTHVDSFIFIDPRGEIPDAAKAKGTQKQADSLKQIKGKIEAR